MFCLEKNFALKYILKTRAFLLSSSFFFIHLILIAFSWLLILHNTNGLQICIL